MGCLLLLIVAYMTIFSKDFIFPLELTLSSTGQITTLTNILYSVSTKYFTSLSAKSRASVSQAIQIQKKEIFVLTTFVLHPLTHELINFWQVLQHFPKKNFTHQKLNGTATARILLIVHTISCPLPAYFDLFKEKKNNSPVSVLKIVQQDLLFGVLLFLVQDVCNTPDSQA